jgi:hypothetical protein
LNLHQAFYIPKSFLEVDPLQNLSY